MFTLEQIKEAHSNVKSGADFPDYIKDLVKLGVIYYETYVSDGHSDYFGKDDYKISSAPNYEQISIDEKSDLAQFKTDLKAHQHGKTDYSTFCTDCAKSGIEKWAVFMETMNCIYYEKAGNALLLEEIPQ